MKRIETATFTNICMIYDGNGNVVVQERLDPIWPGITFPGGHVEYGESFTDAVIREVKEETGLTVSNLQMCGVHNWMRDDGSRYVVFMYKTNCFQGELTSSDEGEVWWAPISELPNLKLASGTLGMLKVFMENSLSEHFYYKKNGEWVEVLK